MLFGSDLGFEFRRSVVDIWRWCRWDRSVPVDADERAVWVLGFCRSFVDVRRCSVVGIAVFLWKRKGPLSLGGRDVSG